ncbi:hypothetical protein [Rubritalea tangerina]
MGDCSEALRHPQLLKASQKTTLVTKADISEDIICSNTLCKLEF